jgi:hypothetical protein
MAHMASKAGKLVAGTSVLGLGGLAAVAISADKPASAERVVTTIAKAPPVEVQTITVRRVIHRTIHEKRRHTHHTSAVAVSAPAAGAAAASAPAEAPAPVVQPAPVPTSTAPAPMPERAPIRTRTSGSGGSTTGEDDGYEHEGGDD